MSKKLSACERDWTTIQAALLVSPYSAMATSIYPARPDKPVMHIMTRLWVAERLQAFDELRYKLHQTNNIKRRTYEKRQR